MLVVNDLPLVNNDQCTDGYVSWISDGYLVTSKVLMKRLTTASIRVNGNE